MGVVHRRFGLSRQCFFKNVGWVKCQLEERLLVAVGFYGSNLKVGYRSVGGWDNFGAESLVTRSVGNVLYELDGQSALDLYKMYLVEKAKKLPSSALLFEEWKGRLVQLDDTLVIGVLVPQSFGLHFLPIIKKGYVQNKRNFEKCPTTFLEEHPPKSHNHGQANHEED